MRKIAIDTETTGLNRYLGARAYAVSAFDGEDAAYWEWRVDPFTRAVTPRRGDLRELRVICRDPGLVKTFFNGLFDMGMLAEAGVRVRGPVAETSFKARAFNNMEFGYALKPLCDKYLLNDPGLADLSSDDKLALHKATVVARRIAKKCGWAVAEDVESDYWMIEELWRRHPEQAERVAEKMPRGLCERYATHDAERTYWLDEFYDGMIARVDAEAAEAGVAQDARGTYEREMALLPETSRLRSGGVCIDLDRMRAVERECEASKADALAVLRDAAGRGDFNPSSPKQVAALLYEQEGLKPLLRTKTGADSTKSEAVLPYKANSTVNALLRYRAADKAISTFFAKYEALLQPTEHAGVGRLHPGYRQWGTLTGRYACAEPNLQAVSDPLNTNSRIPELMVNVRQCFIPWPGCVWFCPDYDQLEVLIFADVSQEPTMLDAIRRGVDIHTATTNKVWGGEGNPKAHEAAARVLELAGRREGRRGIEMLLEEFEWDIVRLEEEFGVKVWRKLAKTVTFTKIFGGGYKALMSWLGVGERDARRILADYDSAFPEMLDRMAALISDARHRGYVANAWGRRLVIDPFNTYRVVNYLVQSAAADLMKDGMRRCARYLRDVGLRARICMTIHDELVFEFHRSDALKSALRELCRLMADHGGRFGVATPVSMDRVTERWSDKEKVAL